MSRDSWTHTLCLTCWNDSNPGREPVRMIAEEVEAESCCLCGVTTTDGIYTRFSPDLCQLLEDAREVLTDKPS